MKYNNVLTILLLLLFTGCSRIPKEIKRSQLYSEVINHYENIEPDKQKKEAALFLFRYMNMKYSVYDEKADSILTFFVDSIDKAPNKPDRTEIIASLIRLAPKSHEFKIIKDIDIVDSKDLIQHIDITYKNWQYLSKKSGASFNDYCEYILPYRLKEEPFTQFTTSLFESHFKALSDTLYYSDSIVSIIPSFIKSIGCGITALLSNYYPTIISARHLFQIKITSRCDDSAILSTLMLRSIGIPATYDYLPQWGNHPYMGHSWVAVKWQQKWYAFDAFYGKYLSDMYQSESIPKVFRQTYSISSGKDYKDVTNEYQDVIRIQVNVKDKSDIKTLRPSIAVFNKYQGFKVVDYGEKEGSNFVFNNLGRRVVYFIGGLKDDKFTPLSNPIFVDSSGISIQLIPNWSDLHTYQFHRKYPLVVGKRSRKKINWAKSPEGSWIEASSDNFRTIDTLLVLNNYNSYKEEHFNLNHEIKYSAIRYCCGPRTQLATLNFFNHHQELLTGKIINDLSEEFRPEILFDNDMLTWTKVGRPSRFVYVGYEFKRPEYISSVAIHARNDGNHIVIGDEYELMVWDNGWKSIGIKTAEKQEIEFSNVPSSGLYWLKNLSHGIEELPFMMTEDGKQFWAGQ